MQVRFIFLITLVSAFIASLVSGCAFGPTVPGTEFGGTYCIATTKTKEYRETIKTSNFSYGRYKNYSVSRNGSLCGLAKFHLLNVKWETLNGNIREEEIDVRALIKNLKLEKNVPIGYGPPNLEIRLNDNKLIIFYKIFDLKLNDPEKPRYEIYNLLN